MEFVTENVGPMCLHCKSNWLLLFGEIIATFSEKSKKHIHKLNGQMQIFLMLKQVVSTQEQLRSSPNSNHDRQNYLNYKGLNIRLIRRIFSKKVSDVNEISILCHVCIF
jgi:hypothetical protein